MDKPFKTYQEQIQQLIERSLLVEDDKIAKKILESEGYYNLINGYKDIFLASSKPTEVYLKGASFNQIFELYDFDRKLRIKILNGIFKIENTLKSIIAYEFAKAHGELSYTNILSFNNERNKKHKVINLISDISNTINKYCLNKESRFDCLRHYKDNHDGIPIWVLFNCLSLGTISIFYSCLQIPTKIAIIEHINSIYDTKLSTQDLANYLRILVTFRNSSAHGQRVFSTTSRVTLSLNNESVIKYSKDIKNLQSLDQLFIAFHDLLSKTDFLDIATSVAKDISAIMNKLPKDIEFRFFNKLQLTLTIFLNLLEING